MKQELRIMNEDTRSMKQEVRIMDKNSETHNSRFILHTSAQKGFSLVEGVLAAGLLGIVVTALVGLFIYGQESTRVGGERMIAVFLAEEGMEAVRNIRDSATGFGNIPADSTYGLIVSGSPQIYSLSGSSDTTPLSPGGVEVYTRRIAITSLATPTRKKAVVTVTWDISPVRQGKVEIESHFTDWR